MWVQSLSQEDPLEEGTATQSNILAWRITWTEETGSLESIGGGKLEDVLSCLSGLMSVSV